MSAKELIELAASKGYGISRYKSNVYEYSHSDGQTWTVKRFNGTWQEFVKFVKSLPDLKG